MMGEYHPRVTIRQKIGYTVLLGIVLAFFAVRDGIALIKKKLK